MATVAIRVHGLEDALAAAAAAAELGCPVEIVSAPGAGYWAGPLWFLALVAQVRCRFPMVALAATLDCGGHAGAVLAAVRAGVPRILYTGEGPTARRLAELAERAGIALTTADKPAVDPRNHADKAAFCRAALLDQ